MIELTLAFGLGCNQKPPEPLWCWACHSCKRTYSPGAPPIRRGVAICEACGKPLEKTIYR